MRPKLSAPLHEHIAGKETFAVRVEQNVRTIASFFVGFARSWRLEASPSGAAEQASPGLPSSRAPPSRCRAPPLPGVPDGPPLRPPCHDRDLGARGALSHLVRDRGARDREAGRTGRGPRKRCQGAVGLVGDRSRDRRRRDRRDRGGDQARCDRLPDLGGRAGGRRSAVHAPGHDQFGRARHHAVGPARAGERHAYSRISTRCSPRSGAAPRSTSTPPRSGAATASMPSR